MFSFSKDTMPTEDTALPGRDEPMPVTNRHFVNQHPIQAPFPEHLHQAIFGLGCFWGAEKAFWQKEGVYTTAVGYCAGFTIQAEIAASHQNQQGKLLRSISITETSSLLRTEPSLCPALILSPRGISTCASLLISGRQVLMFRIKACMMFMPPLCRLLSSS